MQAAEVQSIPQLESTAQRKNTGNQETTWEMKSNKKGSPGRHRQRAVSTKRKGRGSNAEDKQVRPVTQGQEPQEKTTGVATPQDAGISNYLPQSPGYT